MKLLSGLLIDENMTSVSKFNLKLIDGYLNNFRLTDGKFVFKFPIVSFEAFFTKSHTDELLAKKVSLVNDIATVSFELQSSHISSFSIKMPLELPSAPSFVVLNPDGTVVFSNASQYDQSFSFPYPTTETVGGLEAGTLLVDTTLRDIIFKMLYKEKSPTLVDPSVTLTKNVPTLQEIGATVNLTFTATFNRGLIDPAYGTSGYRSGLPQKYTYSGPGLNLSVDKTELTDIQTVNSVTVTLGQQTWTVIVDYAQGEVPMTNFGNPAGAALPAGSVMASTSIIGVYPFFATSSSINTFDKLPLTDANVVTFTVAAESTTQKQSFDVPPTFTVAAIQNFNPITQQWQNISMSTFDQSDVTRNINGIDVSYKRFIHNGPTIGQRQIRLIKQ